jgi:hypothetical protein
MQIFLQEFKDLRSAESGTNSNTLKITNHGLVTGDIILNTTRTLDGFIYSSSYVVRVDDNTLTTINISGQAINDTILLFHFVDRTENLVVGTLRINKNADRRTNLNLTFYVELEGVIDPAFLFLPRAGQILRVVNNNVKIFTGVIQIADAVRRGNADSNGIYIDVVSDGFESVSQRRTVVVEFIDTNAGNVVKAMVNNYLFQEGITQGTIIDGAEIFEYPANRVEGKDIREIFNDMAELSGAVWYINPERELHFVQFETIIDSPQQIIDEGTFKDFWNVRLNESLENYRNKQFVRGGVDDDGEIIFVGSTNYEEVNRRQLVEGGTGVYGNILENPNIFLTEYRECASGTNTTTIITNTAHGLQKGDIIVNFTRNVKRQVITVTNSTTFTVSAVTDQTVGDEIKFYPDANNIMRKLLATYGRERKLSFTTSNLNFDVLQKLRVNLKQLAIKNEDYFIDEVEYFDVNGKTIHMNVRATLRDFDNISIQAVEGWEEYFRRALFEDTKVNNEFLTELKIDDNGMILDFKNGASTEYEFIKEDGKIIGIKNLRTGVTANINDMRTEG